MKVDPNRGTQPLKNTRPLEAKSRPVQAQSSTASLKSSQEKAGLEALWGAFTQAIPQPTEVTKALFGLFAKGSLSPQAASELSAKGIGPSDLLAEAFKVAPAFSLFGPIGGALAMTVMGNLKDANGLQDLVDSPLLRRKTAEALPNNLAETLSQGRSPAFSDATKEVIHTGRISSETYSKMTDKERREVYSVLDSHRDELDNILDPWGKELLSEAIDAGKSATRTSTYKEYEQAFERAVPPSNRPYFFRPENSKSGSASFQSGSSSGPWDAQGSAEGFAGADGSYSLDGSGLKAQGRVGAGGTVQGSASGRIDAGPVDLEGRVSGKATGFAGAEASIVANGNGAQIRGVAGASASVEVDAEGKMGVDLGGLQQETLVQGHAEVDAHAKVEVEADLGLDEKGNFQAYFKGDASAELEAEANAKLEQTINIFGFKFSVAGFAGAKAGVGASASVEGGYKDGKFSLGTSGGLAAVIGAKLGAKFSIELPDWAKGAINGVANFFAAKQPAKAKEPAGSSKVISAFLEKIVMQSRMEEDGDKKVEKHPPKKPASIKAKH